MTDQQWPSQLAAGLDKLGLQLDAGCQQQQLAFLALLEKWNRAYNLTAVRDPAQMVSRQLLDSVAILPFISADHVLDVGAGGGLPALPLALACPDRQFTLLDTNSKKTRFLTQCVLELKLTNVNVVNARAEQFAPEAPFAQITSRAFTSLANMVNWCGHLLADDGGFLAMKGQYPTEEVIALPDQWQVNRDYALTVPGCEGTRHLLIIDRVSSTGG